MKNIISLDDKIRLSRDKKAALIRKQKILAVRKVLQCTQCAFKCEKCGTHIEKTDNRGVEGGHNRIPYRLCESCVEEYIDYINRIQGKGDPDCYWHNHAWLSAWKYWIDYRGASDNYMKSKEFIRLMSELKQT